MLKWMISMLWLFQYKQQFKQFIIWAWSCFHHIFFYHFLGGNLCITHWKNAIQLLNKPFIKRYHVPCLVEIVTWELVYETNYVNAGKDTNITCILSKKIWSQKKLRPLNWILRFAVLIKGIVYQFIQNYKRFSI